MSDPGSRVIALIGSAGIVEGERFVLAPGSEVVIGRSRSCSISLRRAANYLTAVPATRDEDHDLNTVSRRHVKLSVTASGAEIEDLSSNGTFCNGEPVSGKVVVDLSNGSCSVRLGTRERFDLLLLDADDPRILGLEPLSNESSDVFT